MQVFTNDLLAQLAANLTATAPVALGPLDACKMILYTNTFALDRNTVLADLIQPTYTDYAVQAVTWGGVFTTPDGKFCRYSVSVSWQMGDAMLATTVVGFGLINTAGDTLLVAESFATPRNLVATTDLIEILAQVGFANPGVGQSVVLP